ncbi:hypothetical protein A2533_02870 [Candidatus Falkowbacteria bacterium RIFOXYD2_FULL_35_9]|uniref:Multidrug ABC transporter substrate-binding protein n=1 Tax=Candidatus Falkowbacteria bacterium RIFOXYC2_FULL_36_12 TaxID=1798002 RepID=A0A1F5SYM5_9BACT|nr:MAG: hypothetical protein A2300_03205 [Candidatus Falkowbacteria bacterium RIFOXYB2_FULL_35_7]OGF31825.1 MAG: hypothetical protein A2478_05070 [Candidatus Falkowbacteria bacterium RIFOXYC2_FULL_36_12]OGF33767.1 MAG: hypothetical protein A2223_00120 [Candidatus Falkowbacteria bacterium RIFOXYA2_FULL_35_8]OGF46299.1 MAG: hypothetical protein A2533_02870 [Candidatus Falkowbacteria bacterium RIFOXYD2_FULL_35_9]
MNLINTIKTAWQSLKRNKSRTFLTVIGIVIGITAVITVLSAGQAIKSLIIGELESFGSNYIQVEVKTPSTEQASTENAFSMVGGSVITSLKESDAQEIAKHPNISIFYTGLMGQEIVSYQNQLKKVFLFGTNEDFINIDSGEINQGRFFDEDENSSLAKVAVLGSKVKNELFGNNDSLGKYIKVGKEKFQVVGEMKERGASFTFDMDNMIFLPVKTLQKKLLGVDYVSFVIAQLEDNSTSAETAEEVTLIMRDQHDITDPNKDDFAVTTMEQAMEMLDIVISGVQILLIALGSISLVVGGVGIMNIMYVSVTERTFEIGLRKAVGAKNKNILWQFLSEAVIITFIGGIIGIALGILLSGLISVVAQSQGFDWKFSVSVSGIVLASLMSMIVGLVFGLYPAKRAAGLNPIDALRHE